MSVVRIVLDTLALGWWLILWSAVPITQPQAITHTHSTQPVCTTSSTWWHSLKFRVSEMRDIFEAEAFRILDLIDISSQFWSKILRFKCKHVFNVCVECWASQTFLSCSAQMINPKNRYLSFFFCPFLLLFYIRIFRRHWIDNLKDMSHFPGQSPILYVFRGDIYML